MTLSTAARAVAIGDFARSTRKELQDDFSFEVLLADLARSTRRLMRGCQDLQGGDTIWYFVELHLEQLYLAYGAQAFELLTLEQKGRLDNALYASQVMLRERLGAYPYTSFVAKLYRESQYVELVPEAQKLVWLDAFLRLSRFNTGGVEKPSQDASGVFPA